MATPWIETLVAVGIVSAISAVGILALAFGGLRRHGLMIFLVALAAGALVGDSFLHALPEAVEGAGEFSATLGGAVVAGFLVFFLLEALFRWGHAHGEAQHANGQAHGIQPFGWLNLIGDGVHNFIDGVLIGAAFLSSPELGIATTIAVALHEIPQELGDYGVLIRAGFTPGKALLVNLGSALTAVLGAVFVLLVPIPEATLSTIVVPLIAGAFVYIASADLVPELHHHGGTKYMPIIVVGILAGVGAMAGLLLLE